MATRRSEKLRHKEMLELGAQNLEYIHGLTSWCNLARIKMMTAGLLAEMSGLPIGSHEVSCQHAGQSHESMNLPWIVPSFILANCIGCKFHQPGKDTTWAEEVIRKANAKHTEQEKIEEERRKRLTKLRDDLQKIPRNAISSTGKIQHSILEYGEKLFSSDADAASEGLRRLLESARIGPELYPSVLINLLLEQTQFQEFGESCLKLCAELAPERADFHSQFAKAAISSISKGISPEDASLLILRLDKHVSYPLPNETIGNLISFQDYCRPIGGWSQGEPEYPSSIELLVRCHKADPSQVLKALRNRLQNNDKHIRVNICGIIEKMQELNPEIGLELLEDLVNSLALDDDPYETSADGAACLRIADCFIEDCEKVDDYLASRISSATDELEAILIKPYWMVLSCRNEKAGDKSAFSRKVEDKCIMRALRRCIDVARSDRLEIETRQKAAEALEAGCRNHPDIAISFIDVLLGMLALLEQQPSPPPRPPKIQIPGTAMPKTEIIQLENVNRQTEWKTFKSFLRRSLEELAEERPQVLCDSIIRSIATLDSKTNAEFKSSLVDMLGKIGKDYVSRPLVLPTLMKVLMDYDSVKVRATAISAVEEVFRYAHSDMPSDILDILILHLRDPYVAIHRTAISAVRRSAGQFNEQQAAEAMGLLAIHAKECAGNPYEVDDVCETIFAVARKNIQMRRAGLKIFSSVFPTNEQHVDEPLVNELLYLVEPVDTDADFAIHHIVTCLENYERDRYNSFEYQRHARFFEWMHSIPRDTFMANRKLLLKAAKTVAGRDPWESCFFCSIFVQFNDFAGEQEILSSSKTATDGEKSKERFSAILQNLYYAAVANAHKIEGRTDESRKTLDKLTKVSDERD